MVAVVAVLVVVLVLVVGVLALVVRRLGALAADETAGRIGRDVQSGVPVGGRRSQDPSGRSEVVRAPSATEDDERLTARAAEVEAQLAARVARVEAELAARAERLDEELAARAARAEDEVARRTADAEGALAERTERADAERADRERAIAARQDEIERALAERQEDLERTLAVRQADLERRAADLDAELARLAGISPAEARAEVLATVLADAQREAALQLRRVEADATAHADARAREIVTQAVQRVATPTTAEATVATIALPSEDYKGRIIGREGRNIRAFETTTGVDVIIDDTPQLVQLSCFDPVRREVGRLTMASLVADGRIHPQRIEETYAASLAEVDAVCRRAAEDALLAVGIDGLHPELVAHLGALRFRTSYGQNVLAHLVESAAIARTMAAELGADVDLVTRCAFLHDIGKALTHELPGSHALVGADLARRYGESEAVVHAIEAHHDEVAPRTIEAVLTQASDACSGGRPGARRESAAAYTERLAKIEAIASAQPGVERVFAVQAGHEVRVMVSPDTVDDLAAAQVARAVAKQIEQELTYPGQIRVTVIRESRVSEVAH